MNFRENSKGGGCGSFSIQKLLLQILDLNIGLFSDVNQKIAIYRVARQILLLIMRNPPSFFLTNAGDSFCNSYVYHLVGLHVGQ